MTVPDSDEYRFRAIEQHLDRLEHTVRALGPAVGQVAEMSGQVIAAVDDIVELKKLARDVELSAAARLRELEAQVQSAPTQTLKLIGIVVGVFAGLSGAIITLAEVFR